MNNLEALRAANPQMKIASVEDGAFQNYGSVIALDAQNWIAAAQTVEFPETGCRYVASLEALENIPEAADFRREHCGGLDEQFGLCWGHNSRLNALEWHTCNEFNIAVRDLVLLLAKRADLDADGRLDSGRVKAFYLPRGTCVEIYADTLHYTPCQVTADGFSCIVGLQRGTNLPLKERQGKLWAANKWLLAHEKNSALTEKGAVPGIYGENHRIQPIV